jgi:hypothetical protein
VRKIRYEDLLDNPEYIAGRDQFRRDIIAYKKIRRVQLGELVSVLFENRRTLWYQTQEMLRAEHIEDPRLRREEMDVYNDMLADGLTLAATLLIEIPDSSQIPAVLQRMTGCEEHVTLWIDDQPYPAEAEPGRSREDKTSSIHYLTVPLGPKGLQALTDAERVEVRIDHPTYQAAARLGADTVASLLADLTEPE